MDTEQSLPSRSYEPADTPMDNSVRFVQPLWQTALFVTLSFGLYLLPWSNRCWRFCNAAWLARQEGTRRSPLGRSFTFLIPLYGWFYTFYRLAADIESAADIDAALAPGLLDTIFVGSWIAARALPFPWGAVLALGGLLTCVLTLQREVNHACEREQPGALAQKRLGWQAFVGIPLGLLLWVGFGCAVYQQYRVSSGIAAIHFGHGIDPATLALVQPTSRFGSDDTIVWLAHLNARVGATTVHRTIDQRVGSRFVTVVSDDLTISDPNAQDLYEGEDQTSFSGAALTAGAYEVRFWRGTSVIAEGTFALSGPTSNVPDLVASDGTDFTGYPFSIAPGANGAMYVTDAQSIDRITAAGVITKFGLPSANGLPAAYGVPLNIASDGAGSLWFTEQVSDQIGRLWPDGHVSEQAVPGTFGALAGITAGPQHQIWFTDVDNSRIGEVDTAGGISMRALPEDDAYAVGVAAGSKGDVWLAENHQDEMVRLSPDGRFSTYPLPTLDTGLSSVAIGPRDTVWFTEATANHVGRIDQYGHIREYPLPISLSGPQTITLGSDGAMWFTERAGNRIGRITMAGSITEFPVPTPASQPVGIAAGSHGTIWFTEAAAHQVGVLTPDGKIHEFSIGSAPVPAGTVAPPANKSGAYGPPGSKVHVISIRIPGRAGSTSAYSNPSYLGGMTIGADGRPWFTEPSANVIGTLRADGTVRMIPIKFPVNACSCGNTSDDLESIVTGPDQNLWFTAHYQQIGRLTPDGRVTLYALPTGDDVPSDLTPGPDGNLWFLDSGANQSLYLARITPDGHLTRIHIPKLISLSDVATGLGKTLWFTGDLDHTVVARYDLISHRLTTFTLPTDNSSPGSMLMGPDHRIWITESNANQLAAVTAKGVISEYPLPMGGPDDASTQPDDLVMGPDHHLWFLETGANRLGRVDSHGKVTDYALPPLAGNLTGTPGGLIVDHQGNFWYAVSGDASDGGSGPGKGALVEITLKS
jgi:streptogramin lyase